MRAKTRAMGNRKYRNVKVSQADIEFTARDYVIYQKKNKTQYLMVDSVLINPVTDSVEYRLVNRPNDLKFSVTTEPKYIKNSRYFKNG